MIHKLDLGISTLFRQNWEKDKERSVTGEQECDLSYVGLERCNETICFYKKYIIKDSEDIFLGLDISKNGEDIFFKIF